MLPADWLPIPSDLDPFENMNLSLPGIEYESDSRMEDLLDNDGVGSRIAIEADIAGAASDIEKVLT